MEGLSNEPRIGVYICHCGTNIAGVINVEELTKFASELPNVVIAKNYQFVCSKPGQEMIIEDIKQHNLNRVVIAACSPRMHEPTFRRTIQSAGLNPYLLEMVNIREHCTWVHEHEPDKALDKAKALVAAAVARASSLEPLEEKELPIVKSALVIGGGIAGLFAALTLANSGVKVYVVESSPTIGGKMAMLDKTFPTLDCSKCILTPIMNEVANHPNIELLTYAEVVDVQGSVGDFKVKVLLKPRYVDPTKCKACGECAKKCPALAPNEFDMGLSKRKAIYLTFPQAVPTVYTIDPNVCLYFTKRDRMGRPICGVCQKICPAQAVDFNMQPKTVEINVGAIIIATGFETFDPRLKKEYKYGVSPRVITSLEFERILCATGPTGGRVLCPPDWKEVPKRVVFIQCVGSRDLTVDVPYCSKVCCMYTAKQAILYKERVPDGEAYVIYIDVRAAGKGFEEFYRRAVEEFNVTYIKGRIGEVVIDPETNKPIIRVEDTLTGCMIELEADLVVLAVGLRPSPSTLKIAELLKVSRSPDGFLQELHAKLYPVQTAVDGVFICGCAQGPKDIPDSVAQAKAAASAALEILAQGFVRTIGHVALVDKELCSGCGICVSVCPYDAIAIKIENDRRVASVEDVKCKGCGSCAAACPSGAMQQKHFKDVQLMPVVKTLATA